MVHLPHSFRSLKYIIKQLILSSEELLAKSWYFDVADNIIVKHILKEKISWFRNARTLRGSFVLFITTFFLQKLMLILQNLQQFASLWAFNVSLTFYPALSLDSTISHPHSKNHEFSTRIFRKHTHSQKILPHRKHWYLWFICNYKHVPLLFIK